MGIAIVVASLALGASQTYYNSTTFAGFFAYTPNAFVAIVGVIVVVLGAVVDPMIETSLRRRRESN
ncbi:MAG: hypothetical protein ABSB56_05165 [Nitrososphaerales archaeon]